MNDKYFLMNEALVDEWWIACIIQWGSQNCKVERRHWIFFDVVLKQIILPAV